MEIIEIERLRKLMGTNPKEEVKLTTEFYEGVKGIKVELYDWPVNPYRAIVNMATSTWGSKINKWDNLTPEGRFFVIKAVLDFKSLPNAMEAFSFTFGIEGCSRSAFDQIARARIGSVFSCLYSGKHKIFTSKGQIMIKDIQIGDLVLTHMGRFRPVTNVFRGLSNEKYTIFTKSYGGKVTVTPEHPFLVQKNNLQIWVKGCELSEGDEIIVLGGKKCEICEKILPAIKPQSGLKRRDRFCGTSCQRKWWMTTEEAANINGWYKKIQDPRRMTQPERIISGILKYLNREYVYGYRVKTKENRFLFIDFAFPKQKIGIEVHGFINTRIKGKSFDEEKNNIRIKNLNDLGWKIIEFKGDEILNNIDKVIKEIESGTEKILLSQNDEHQFKFTTLKVTKIIHKIGKNRQWFNLEVAEDNSYIASGIVMHNSMGWRDNCHSDIGFRVPQSIWDNSLSLASFKDTCLTAKNNYHDLVSRGQSNWQDARAHIPISACHNFSMAMNYMALRNFCNKRSKFCEQADTVAIAWLVRERVKEKFPLLGLYLRPNCDWKGICEYHQEYAISEAFGCLFKECGRNKCLATDNYATFNKSCSDKNIIEKQLGIKIPGPKDDMPLQHISLLSLKDRKLLESK